mgnify:CR=1 FL=1
MDSLSQITLGAAVGELLLGKKIGNRAMVWGAVAGTIPDLDVVGNYFMTDLNGLLFHRGISHSILFSILGAIVVGFFIQKLYSSRFHNAIAISAKLIASLVVLKVISFLAGIFSNDIAFLMIIASLIILGLFLRHIKRKYLSGTWQRPEVTREEWQWMLFWVFLTHILLDCFTLYGTQIFAPFSNYKVSWGTVSVADPMYTVPFLLCLLAAAFFSRESKIRYRLNHAGLIISSLYLAFTVSNKFNVNSHLEGELKAASTEAFRFSTNATLLNNILWSCTAESEEYYYIGEYSFFDEVPVEFHQIEKNHDLLSNIDSDPTISSLRWFSDDYFCITEIEEGLLFNDLRFGMFRDNEGKPAGYIFSFLLTENEDGSYTMSKYDRGPKDDGRTNFFENLFKRIKGRKMS